MQALLVFASVVALAAAQYDYSPPQRQFNAGGNRPTYGLPNHTPGTPQGPESLVSSAPVVQQQPQQQYRQPQQQQQQFRQSQQQQQQFRQPQQQQIRQPQQQQQQEEAYTPQTFKHVYVHVAPDEPADVQSRTIRVPGGDKHVNIIFVKTPSSSSQQETEVILPEQDEHKNLVYVLLKKGEATSDVKIRRPAPAPQRKPEVYFIKYADQQQQQQQQNGGYSQAPSGISAPAPITSASQVPSSGYGAPF